MNSPQDPSAIHGDDPSTLPTWAVSHRIWMGDCLDREPLPTPGLSGPYLLPSLLTRVKLSVNSKAAFSLMALGAVPFPIFPWQSLFTHSPEPQPGRPEPGSPGGTDPRKKTYWTFTTIDSKCNSRGASAEYLMIHFFKDFLLQGDRPVSISLKTSGLEVGGGGFGAVPPADQKAKLQKSTC